MMGWNAQKKRYCRMRCPEHAEEGDVPKSKYLKATNPDPANRSTSTRPSHRLPINVERLPDEPALIVRMGPDWLKSSIDPLSWEVG